MNKMNISKKKNTKSKKLNKEKKEASLPSSQNSEGSSEEEKIDTNVSRSKRLKKAKRLQREPIHPEKEEYLSNLYNVADLISSSSSSEDNISDDEFNIEEIIPESDTGTDDSSLLSSPKTNGSVSNVEQSDSDESIGLSSIGKKRLTESSVYLSDYKEGKKVI